MHPSFRARSGYDSRRDPHARALRNTRSSRTSPIACRRSTRPTRPPSPPSPRPSSTTSKLWGTLAEDLLQDGNQLPVPLRAQLLSLAEFVRKHSLAVLGGRASVAALIDINTAIMKGLRGEMEAAA